MRIVLQRVSSAKVEVNQKVVSSIEGGLLLLVGVEAADENEDLEWICKKIANLRIFEDSEEKMNCSIMDTGGEILAVSQFTLHANVKKGNRPSFNRAAPADFAEAVFENFQKKLSGILKKEVKKGVFGADMDVSLVNQGPVTLIIDSKNKTL